MMVADRSTAQSVSTTFGSGCEVKTVQEWQPRAASCSSEMKLLGRQQLLKPDRKLSDANAGRMIDRVSNRRGGPHITKLANAFHSDRIDEIVSLRNQNHFNFLNVGVDRNEIVSKVIIDVARDAPVDL